MIRLQCVGRVPTCLPMDQPQAAARLVPGLVVTSVPNRLDRLPWGQFHWLVVVALGITWILDGIEVTLSGTIAGALRESPVLRFTAADVGIANSAYLAGAVIGALFFGWLTDRLGRKRLFSVTVLVYLLATAATALAWDLGSFALFRFLTGAGIGGEYSAINSAIQELIPARFRGRTDLAINGSFWAGTAFAALCSLVLLDPAVIDPETGWRVAFLGGAAIGVIVLWLRRYIPESPRWLVVHGEPERAARIVGEIEQRLARAGHGLPPAQGEVRLRTRRSTALADVARTLFRHYRRRTLLGLGLMTAQAFFYNAIFFTYAMILTDFYAVPAGQVGWYLLPFALGNLLGPLLLGPLFDTIGRRQMITATYAASALLLAATGWLFARGTLNPATQTLAWSLTFFFASAAASSAYLTVAEAFPLETRALAIAIFYAIGTAMGGVLAPWLFSLLIESGSRGRVFVGYLFGATLMALAAALAWKLGIRAERQPLEAVARPLSWEDD